MRNQRCECFLGGSQVLAEFEDDNVVLLDVDVLVLLALVTAAAGEEENLSVRILDDCRIEVVGSGFLRQDNFADFPVNLFCQLWNVIFCVAH